MSDNTSVVPASLLPSDTFVRRHVAPADEDVSAMLELLGVESLDALVDEAIPSDIRLQGEFVLRGHTGSERELGEREVLAGLRETMSKNQLTRALIGCGYHDTITPPVILRNILENPGWYTQYTPYQAEISQGRLEALLNFQTMVSELTGLEVSNSSLLDEATAAAEAMTMCWGAARKKKNTFIAAADCHPQTLNVLKTRAEAAGLNLKVVAREKIAAALDEDTCGVLVQYPTTYGAVEDYGAMAETVQQSGALFVVAADLLALTILRPPGEFGADICVGSAQRFGVPMGYGGPHAAFLSTTEKFKRQIPGRIIGVSKDSHGKQAYRMAMQTREQHIRREKATSNICTAQVLLAIIAGAYGTYHGPDGLVAIAERVRGFACVLAKGLTDAGLAVRAHERFDTVWIDVEGEARQALIDQAVAAGFELRIDVSTGLGISLDECTDVAEMDRLLAALGSKGTTASLAAAAGTTVSGPHARSSAPLTHEIFNLYHAEHEMLRYLYRLQQRDLSLTTSMIALGSCTMKLNATSEMLPVTWPEVGGLHPFVPVERALGWAEMIGQLEDWLCDITGFAAMSMQPNAGSQGEYAGLLSIRAYHHANGDQHRNICLIPVSAHGTNPASAVMAGMKVVVVKCDELGNIDVEDLQAKAEKHKDELAALMVTYPSTHGVFEASIQRICKIVHDNGGQVYLDGANMNAQVGLCRPGDYGADVCHLNLHKTFCIPHGGGGPGMGPIGLAAHLAPFAPGHPLVKCGGEQAIDAVSAAPWGSSSILPISWVYIAAMGAKGLIKATQVAILNANYMAKRLGEHYPLLYTGLNGRVAHEFIIDLRPFKKAGVEAEDVAKRLMDYGFHAPTMSFPVAGTLMIEPTESESRAELDRFCDAMIAIRGEIAKVEAGDWPKDDSPLSNAPHPADVVLADDWTHAYPRSVAAYPLEWVRANKFWPSVSRIDNAFGDRHLICTCPPLEAYEEAAAE